MAGEQKGADGTRASGFVHNSENRMPRDSAETACSMTKARNAVTAE